MTESFFNSDYEMALRLLLLLNAAPGPRSMDWLHGVDFMVVEGRSFGLSERDLNGIQPFRAGIFAGSRPRVHAGLLRLVKAGYATGVMLPTGAVYLSTMSGNRFGRSLSSTYAQDYRSIAKRAVSAVRGLSDRDVLNAVLGRIVTSESELSD